METEAFAQTHCAEFTILNLFLKHTRLGADFSRTSVSNFKATKKVKMKIKKGGCVPEILLFRGDTNLGGVILRQNQIVR